MERSITKLLVLVVILTSVSSVAYSQQSATAPPAEQNSTSKATQSSTLAADFAPQANAIVHRLSGFKMLNLIRRNGVKVAPLSDEALLSNSIQTNITAGLSLEDGLIVARLPRAELELFEGLKSSEAQPSNPTGLLETQPSLLFINRDGHALSLQFVGIDGGTGLSLLKVLSQEALARGRDAVEESLVVGQRVRLMFPSRSHQADGLTSKELFVSMNSIDAILSNIARSPSGNITRLMVRAENLTSENIGGVAVNDAGETIGLVETSNGNEALITPVAGIRRAVNRIRSRLGSKPQPWLGARGASVAAISKEQLEFAGWKGAQATTLLNKQIGVVLTAIPPKTPAWNSKLRVGDVITRINGDEITSADKFSSMLAQADFNRPLQFTVLRPDRIKARILPVKLEVVLNPVREMEAAEDLAARLNSSNPWVVRGIETFAITQTFADRLNARLGLLVIFVHPSSAASHAGVQVGDVIESVDNKPLVEGSFPATLPAKTYIDVVRNGQKQSLVLEFASNVTPAPKAQ